MIDYFEMWNEDPLYMAFGAYTGVSQIARLIKDTQSFNVDTLIAEWETYDITNPVEGVGGWGAWWPDSHDLVGSPLNYALWYQWQNGTKIMIPSFTGAYSNNLVQGIPTIPMGTMKIPPWVLTVYEA